MIIIFTYVSLSVRPQFSHSPETRQILSEYTVLICYCCVSVGLAKGINDNTYLVDPPGPGRQVLKSFTYSVRPSVRKTKTSCKATGGLVGH